MPFTRFRSPRRGCFDPTASHCAQPQPPFAATCVCALRLNTHHSTRTMKMTRRPTRKPAHKDPASPGRSPARSLPSHSGDGPLVHRIIVSLLQSQQARQRRHQMQAGQRPCISLGVLTTPSPAPSGASCPGAPTCGGHASEGRSASRCMSHARRPSFPRSRRRQRQARS